MVSSYACGQNVSVKINTHKFSLVLGEPLYVVVRIENKGQQPVGILYGNGPSYDPGQGWAQIMISSGDDKFHVWSDQLRPLEKVSALGLKAGQTLTNEFVILYRRQDGQSSRFAFPSAGDYQIVAECVLGTGEIVRAEPVNIKVLEPAGIDADAWAELREDTSYGAIIQIPWDTRVTSSERDRLIEKYGRVRRSVYAQYIALSIGRHAVYAREGEQKDAREFLCVAEVESNNDFVKKKVLHTESLLIKKLESIGKSPK